VSKGEASAGVVAIALVLVFIGASALPPGPPGYDLEAYPFGTLIHGPSGLLLDFTVANSYTNECNDGLDNDGDGVSDESDPSCIMLADAYQSGNPMAPPNGVCDSRVLHSGMGGMVESGPDYAIHPYSPCTGWE
jgi:hypothetical protein